MGKKRKDKAADGQDSIVEAVSASAQQIWQAGLGAFAAAREDGGKLFEALVHDGEPLHQLTRELGRNKLPDVAGKAGQLAEDVARQANASWDRIEQYLENRVAETLHRIGVPSRDDVEMLRREVAALQMALRTPAARRSVAKAAEHASGARARKPGAARTVPNGSAAKRLA
jgi:poly(hydroxyalkanoate) granule-associated protein